MLNVKSLLLSSSITLVFAVSANAQDVAQPKTVEELQAQIHVMQQQMQQMQYQLKHMSSYAAKQDSEITQQKLATTKIEEKVNEQSSALSSVVGTDGEYAHKMLNWQENVVGKPRVLLETKKNADFAKTPVVVSGILKGSVMAEETNENGKFAILSRFPSQHSGNTGTRAIINNMALGVTGNINDYVSIYNQIEYSEIEYPGQDDLQLRKAYVTIGNLNKSPFYGVFGRNTIDFGDMDSYNPFTHTMNNHYFNAVSDDPLLAVGYYDHGTDIVVTGINGGRQLRVADNRRKSHMNNFAVNANQTFDLSSDGTYQLRFGGGYLHSTIYNTVTPHHTAAAADAADDAGFVRNGAWDALVEYTSPSWDVMAEYTQTTRDWLATDDPVKTFTAQTAYRLNGWGLEHELSAVFSRGEQGDEGTEFERMEQIVVGYETELWKNAFFGMEYVHNRGFVPLINITTVSDRSVVNNSLIMGGRFVF